MQQFQGVHVALVTPRGKQGEVDFGAMFELLDHCAVKGVGGVVLFGEEGEGPVFTIEERSRLVYLAVKRSRVPVLVGVGSPALDISVALAHQACDAGAAAILLPPPFFYDYEPGEIVEYSMQFARQMGSAAPVLFYNTPFSTSALAAETALELLGTGRFAGMVEAGAERQTFACLESAAACGKFQLLAGHDALFVDARRAGCGAVSAAACAVPELAVAIDRAIRAADGAEIDRLGGLWSEFLEWADRFPRPVIVKTATALRGLKTGGLPAPLSPAKQQLLKEFGEWFRGWVPAVEGLSAHA